MDRNENFIQTNNNSFENESLLNNTSEEEISINVEQNKPQKPKRVYWLDALRVYASFLVVATHCCYVYLPISFISKIGHIITFYVGLMRCCVPFFIMISGIFFLDPEKELSYKKLYSRYILRILKSYVFWAIYYNFFDEYVIGYKQNYNYIKSFDFFKINLFNLFYSKIHLWYLNFVIGLYIATPLYRAIVKDRKLAWYLISIFFMNCVFFPTLCDIFDKLGWGDLYFIRYLVYDLKIECAGYYSIYYLLGYLLNSKEITNKKYIYVFYIIGFICTIITSFLRMWACNVVQGTDDTFFNLYCLPVFISSISGFLFFKYSLKNTIERFMNSKIFSKLLTIATDCSFGVYLIHMTIHRIYVNFLNITPLMFSPLLWAPIYCVIVYITCLVLVYLLRKIPFFKIIT